MHLHIGFRAAEGELQAMKACGMGLGIHYSVVLDDFEDICKDNNMVIISIPTLLDPGLAPEGHHVLRHVKSSRPKASASSPASARSSSRRPPAATSLANRQVCSGWPATLSLFWTQVLHAYYAADEPYAPWAGYATEGSNPRLVDP